MLSSLPPRFPTFRRWLGIPAVALAVAVGGCTVSEDPAEIHQEPVASPSPTRTESLAADAPIDDAHVCGQISMLLTLQSNALGQLEADPTSTPAFVDTLHMISIGYHHVLTLDRTNVAAAVSRAVDYLDSEPASDIGAPFDPSSADWGAVVTDLDEACREAGSAVISASGFGG